MQPWGPGPIKHRGPYMSEASERGKRSAEPGPTSAAPLVDAGHGSCTSSGGGVEATERQRGRPSAAGASSARYSVLDDQRELLGIEARASDERAVDVRVGHKVADVRGLDASAVLDADAVGQ